MASLVNELIDVLEEEAVIYKQLIPIADEKTQIIVKNNLTALQDITSREQQVVDRLNVLEHKREEILLNIRTVLNKRKGSFDLAALIVLLEKQPGEQRKLSALRDILKESIGRLVEINHRNRMLIEQSLEMIEYNMNFMQSAMESPANNIYTKNAAQYYGKTPGTGMFDTKQ